MSDGLENLHVRLSPEAARALRDAANRAGSSVSALIEAIGRRKALALGADPRLGEQAREVDRVRAKRPGPRNRRTTNVETDTN